MEHGRGEQFGELQVLATSEDYQDRRRAAVGLAGSADDQAAGALLRELVLDAENTAVTLAASTALMERGDRTGLDILAAALATADDQQVNWIEAGIADALGESDEASDKAMAIVRDRFMGARDEAARRGIERLLSLLRSAGLQ